VTYSVGNTPGLDEPPCGHEISSCKQGVQSAAQLHPELCRRALCRGFGGVPQPPSPRGWGRSIATALRSERGISIQNRYLQTRDLDLCPSARPGNNEAKAEDALWQLRRRQLGGFQFRRQHPIDRFIVDFYCSQARLIIEVDGPVHDKTVEADAGRQELLESLGYRILRFTNEQIKTDMGSALDRILDAVQTPAATSPSPWTPALIQAEGEKRTEGERL
jgi:very-short-patch-repair endonuclease